MFSVQAEGCAPIVRAFEAGVRDAPLFEGATTVASGLRVPRAIGDFIMLDMIRATGGAALPVSDRELMDGALELGAATGVCACPEGGACLAATRKLLEKGLIARDRTVVIFNTGTGAKYQEAFAAGR
jgi:threonine synthase